MTDAQGRFIFPNLPFNDYGLNVQAPGYAPIHRSVELRSSLPLDLELQLAPLGTTVVVESRASLVENHPSTHVDLDQSTIRTTSAPIQSRAMESILLATPGFIADDGGRFHFQGSHGQLTYVVDGVPLSDHTHATFSNSMDPAQVENLEVLTAGIPAEYGGKPVAVVNLTTRSGLGTPNGFEGEWTFGVARFQTSESTFTARGGTDRHGYFITGAASRTERFLDPVDFRNFHNHGSTGRLFARFDSLLTDRDTLRFSLSGGDTHREVVNLASQQALGMDQRVTTRDVNANLAWIHVFEGDRSLEGTLFARRATSDLDPTRSSSPEGSPEGPDTPVWSRQNRRLGNVGLSIAFQQRLASGPLVKAGFQAVAFPLHERFAFGITQDGLVTDPDHPLFPYTPAGGGALWHFEATTTPSLTSAFAQMDVHHGPAFLTLGGRYDRWQFQGHRDAELQPRVAFSYQWASTGTILRASYDRLFITPDRENLALSSSHETSELGDDPDHGSGHDHASHRVRPEVQDALSIGFEQPLGTQGRFRWTAWRRRSRNTADVEQFLNTGIEFPIAFAHGRSHGLELRFDLAPTDYLRGYFNLARSRALVEGPQVGGLHLHLGEAAHDHEASGRFPIDHDQTWTSQLGLRYENNAGWLQIQGRYDSGMVAGDPTPALGNPDLAFGLGLIRYDARDGLWRTRPRTSWDLGAGRCFQWGGRRNLTLSASVLNVFDTRALYNFLSHRGGTHVFPPRTWTVRIQHRF